VSVRAIIYFDSRRGDLDNRLKILLDALNGLAWLDDAQIVELYARRELDRRNPRVELTVTEFVKRA
jgi:Holliday junction resolvase RusA-like endonuclease